MLRKSILAFVLALILNGVWEHAHSALYLSYRGSPVTEFILLRAAVADAAMITILIFIAQALELKSPHFVVAGGLVLAVAIEIWALQTGRWAYGPLMPVIPGIGTGLTPTVQLAATGYITQKIIFSRKTKFPEI